MKKIILATLLMFTVGITQGCSNNNSETTKQTSSTEKVEKSSEEKQSEKITFVLVVDDKEVLNKEVSFEEGETLLDLMTREFDVVEDNGMITSIEGYKNDDKESKYLTYYVNGEMPDVGAADYELKANDKIEWKLEKMDF